MKHEWHGCFHDGMNLNHDGSWEDGRWYEWLMKDGKIIRARMKFDPPDHFFPPPNKPVREEDVVAYREFEYGKLALRTVIYRMELKRNYRRFEKWQKILRKQKAKL